MNLRDLRHTLAILLRKRAQIGGHSYQLDDVIEVLRCDIMDLEAGILHIEEEVA
jgi:hypothetical protein